jgi:hypothetical protein
MQGISPYLIPIVAIVALGALALGRRRRPPVDKTGRCSSCETPMSLRRVSILESPTLRVQWVCPRTVVTE